MALVGIVAGSAANDSLASETRSNADRRRMSWRTVAYGFLRSRRHRFRRGADENEIYIDWHHPWLFFLAVGVMLMSVTDAFLTLQSLNLGAIELNPLMDGLITWNTAGFVSLKMLMTAFGLFALIYASRYRLFGRIRVGLFVTMFFCAYLTLTCHHILGFMTLGQLI